MILFMLYYKMAIFQQAGYSLRYLTWVKKNYLKTMFFSIVIAALALFFNKISTALYFIGSIYYFIDIFSLKIKFKITKRSLRLYLTSLFISLLFYKIPIIPIIFLDFIIILSMFINKPIDIIINEYYINKIRIKLSEYKGKVIVIGGSYGKTSVKNYLYELLSKKNMVLITPKSYNTLMGLAKSINDLNNLYDYFIVEVGASKKGDINKIMEIVKPDISILNNIGNQHLETFKDMDTIINEKKKIALMSKLAFVNCDNEYIKGFINDDMITFGIYSGYYRLDNNHNLYINNEFIDNLNIKLIGNFELYNIIASISVCHYLGMDIDIIKDAVIHLNNVDHRHSIKKINETTIIDNSYNTNVVGSIQYINEIKKMDGIKCIYTPGYIDLGSDNYICNKELYNKINEVFDIAYLTNNFNMVDKKILHEVFDIKDAMNHFNNIKGKKILLIENDLTDFYGGII